MPDTAVIENEDALAADFDEAGEEEERPQTFAELGVPGPLVRVLAADGKKTAFPIQADTLPDSLAGRDILGRGRTGSGKTLAFSIPLVARLGEVDADEYENMSQFRHEVEQVRKGHAEERRADDFLPHPRGLVLAPTRELANQINDVLMPLAQMYGMTTTTVYGGVRYARQIRDLRAGADIVVACPGRLEDLLEQHALTLEKVEVAVIDEADEMADMGFLPPVKRLLGQVSFDAQIMLFSATLDHGVDEVVNTFLTDPKIHSVDSATAAVDEMTHHVFETTQGDRHELVRTLASGKGRRILFTRTKFQTQKLAKDLTKNGIPAAELHGNLSQNQRDRNLAAFESGDVNVMVATDVAARGIDVSGVELVVQVEPPEDPKSFLHRSGRTARAGHSGDVVTIVLPNQRRRTRRMLHEAGLKVKPIEVTHDSPEVLELVGDRAERVDGWSLDKSQPVGNPRKGKNRAGSMARSATVPRKTAGAPDATVPADATRTGARTRAASRSSPNARTARIARDVKSAPKSPNASSVSNRNRIAPNVAPPSSKAATTANTRRASIVGNILKSKRRSARSTRRSATTSVAKSTRGCMSSSVPKPANSVEPTIASGAPSSVPISVANPIGSPAKSSMRKSRARRPRSSARPKPVPNAVTRTIANTARTATNATTAVRAANASIARKSA